MRLVKRKIESYVRTLEKEYSVITIVGPRQSGKTTLVKELFPDKPYFSFENPDLRTEIEDDPRGFLDFLSKGAVFDEFQRIPEISSYLQQYIDNNPEPGKYILTGSRSLEIMDRVSQSLVGRSATVELLPFSYSEIKEEDSNHFLINDLICRGLYPPLYHRGFTPSIWFANYVRNYLERDVRQLMNVKDLNTFQRFLVLCAGRVGQLVNYSDISSELGLSHNTIKAWLSVLEASYIIFFLSPFHSNYSKRLVKTPKLYFFDTGLASWLLSVREPIHLEAHPLRGALFENFCVAELLKSCFNKGFRSNLYFWRDKSGHEIDVIIDKGTSFSGVEIKSSKTFSKNFLKNLNYLGERDKRMTEKLLIWGSDETKGFSSHKRYSWRDISLIQ